MPAGEQGAWSHANTYVDRQVGHRIIAFGPNGRTFLGHGRVLIFRPLPLLIAIRM